MTSFFSNFGIAVNQAKSLPYIYVLSIFLGNIISFIILWIVFKGYVASIAWAAVLFLTVIGAQITGDITWYSLGRWLHDTRLGIFIREKIPQHKKIELRIKKSGKKWVFLSSLVYSSSFAILFLVGWAKHKFKEVLKVSILGILTAFLVVAGIAYSLFAGLSMLEAVSIFKKFERLLVLGIVSFFIINYYLAKIFKKLFNNNGVNGANNKGISGDANKDSAKNPESEEISVYH